MEDAVNPGPPVSAVPGLAFFDWQPHSTVPIKAAGALALTATGLNVRGEVVGSGIFGPFERPGPRCGFIRSGCRLQVVRLHHRQVYITGCNALGWMVGKAVSGRAGVKGFPESAFLLRGRRWSWLPGPPGSDSVANAINNDGIVVGAFGVGWLAPGFQALHACEWRRERLVDLGTLGGPESEALGISDRGEVVGQAHAPRSDGGLGWDTRAFVTRNGRMVSLSTPRGWQSTALAVNADGLVVGYMQPPGGERQAVMWTAHGAIPLLMHCPESWATGVNSRGVICGIMRTDTWRAFVLDGPRQMAIDDIGSRSSICPQDPVLVNDRDQVVLGGEFMVGPPNTAGSSNGDMARRTRTRPYLLTPLRIRMKR